jgi:hypothetical protein
MRPAFAFCTALLVCSLLTFDVTAQIDDAPVGTALRPEPSLRQQLSRTRRVGRLRTNPDGSAPYLLRDAWDHRTYFVSPVDDFDLETYVGRYVALHGTVDQASDDMDGKRGFKAQKAVALDRNGIVPRQRTLASVRQVDFQDYIDIPQIEMPEHTLVPGQVTEPLGPGIEPTPLDYDVQIPLSEFKHQSIHGSSRLCQSCAGLHFPLRGLVGLFDGGERCCSPPERFWFRGEYLLWWTDGLQLPPLVTSSPNGTARNQAGVLGEQGTRIINPLVVNNDAHSGARFRAGWWTHGGTLGIGADYYWLNSQVARFGASSTGDSILARPFFDALNGRQTSELVAFPNLIGGSVLVEAQTELESAGIHARINACCSSWQTDCCFTSGTRLDWLVGYRYMKLKDELVVRENLVSQDPLNPGEFRIEDRFRTRNSFNGIELGAQHEWHRGRWMLETLGKMALGNNRQSVSISGATAITEGGVTQNFPAGILTQRTNIGRYDRDQFAMVPELGVTLGYRVSPRLRLTLGYTLVYFSNVVRAGDQVDLDVNPNLFPPEADPFSGPLRPAFVYRETDFWAQGFSFGGDLRW